MSESAALPSVLIILCRETDDYAEFFFPNDGYDERLSFVRQQGGCLTAAARDFVRQEFNDTSASHLGRVFFPPSAHYAYVVMFYLTPTEQAGLRGGNWVPTDMIRFDQLGERGRAMAFALEELSRFI